MKKCIACLKDFEGTGFGSFCSRSCHGRTMRSKRKNNRHTKYNDKDYINQLSKKAIESNKNRFGEEIIEDVVCKNCGRVFQNSHRKNCKKKIRKFCSRNCSNRSPKDHKNKKELIQKFKDIASKRENWGFKNEEHRQTVVANNARNSSKGERKIRNLLKSLDNNWKCHRNFNGKAVDLSNATLKIIVEYDGPSHFRNIYGNLEQQQQKDKNVNEWAILNNWKIYRISDHYFQKIINQDLQVVTNDIEMLKITDINIFYRYSGEEEKY
jgi:very-short-patch-repair endonuclease